VLQWWYSSVTIGSQRCYLCHNSVTMVLQWCYNGVTMVSQWCYNSVPMVFQWCSNGVPMVFQGVPRCYSSVPTASQCPTFCLCEGQQHAFQVVSRGLQSSLRLQHLPRKIRVRILQKLCWSDIAVVSHHVTMCRNVFEWCAYGPASCVRTAH
jgi:hypothetical protein